MLNSLDYGYLIGPRIQIVDADGKPMTGAWLRVFIAGTTTDANTYSDWEGTVQPAKKILDARGETAVIVAVSGAYKIMLCDSTHPVSSPYWYADNVVLTNVSELDVVPIVVDAEVGKLTVTVVTDTLGIKHYVVGIDPAYTAEREAYADGKVADEAARAKAAEAAAKTEVVAGSNASVSKAVAADGHSIYTVSTGQIGASTYETWYLDPVNGLDTNSGLSRSAPKKTGDAVVIACKTAGKTMGRLVVMAGTGTVTFTAANWTNTTFPFSDVVFETAYTECTWKGIVASGIFKIYGGEHTFNSCACGGQVSVKADYCIVNGGNWTGIMNFDMESYITVKGMACEGELCIQTPILEILSKFAINGTAKIQADELYGAGNFVSYANSEVHLDIQTNCFSLEGNFQFPSQAVNSSIKITAAKMLRTATTRLLYLGAQAGVTVNYQLVVDTMGSIVPMEIGNPAGTVAGKVIELLKYENKVDAEIIRATAAEALKENKSEKNAASGYCPLDANVKVPFANIPDSILGQLEYQGVWDASTGNFPAATGSGQYWIASSNGTGATISYSVGDWAVYNGTAFDKVDNSDAVFSVNGMMGNVVLEKADVGLGNVDNVSDVNKPVSTAQQSALDLKANQSSISNVDNTSDANKPVSTAQAAAIAAHADLLTGMHGLPALDHFVYGDTAYGGSIVDNLNSLARTMPFTCYGTSVGAPDTTHSWFGWHINSNAGVVSASQMAIAFGTDLIVKYRTKSASVWGPWRNGSTIVNASTDTAYTFLASDANTCHIVNTSAATTRTVPSDTTAPDLAIGDSIEVQNIGTGVVTFVAASGVTIRSSLTLVMYGQYSVCMLRKIAANTWILTGERTAV